MVPRWIRSLCLVLVGTSTISNINVALVNFSHVLDSAFDYDVRPSILWAANETEHNGSNTPSLSTTNYNLNATHVSTRLLDEWRQLSIETDFIMPNAILRKTSPQESDITVAVHLSPRKLHRFFVMSKRWGGPISASVYINNEEDINTFVSFFQTHESELSQTSFHIIMENTTMEYCHNKLRQLAIEYIDTSYFVILDVDFVTTPDAHGQLRSLINNDTTLRDELHSNTMMVLPAFSRQVDVKDEDLVRLQDKLLPASKDEARNMVRRGNLKEFHIKRFFPGHGPTNFPLWLSNNETANFYFIDYGLRFEPYVLGHVHEIPSFWEGFRGFGYNKWSFYLECHLKGFQFAVLQDFFVVHLDHPMGVRRQSKHNHKQMKKFKKYLNKTYGPVTTGEDVLSDFWEKNLAGSVAQKLRPN